MKQLTALVQIERNEDDTGYTLGESDGAAGTAKRVNIEDSDGEALFGDAWCDMVCEVQLDTVECRITIKPWPR